MICTKCGKKCSDSEVRCSNCGSKLDDFIFEAIDETDEGKESEEKDANLTIQEPDGKVIKNLHEESKSQMKETPVEELKEPESKIIETKSVKKEKNISSEDSKNVKMADVNENAKKEEPLKAKSELHMNLKDDVKSGVKFDTKSSSAVKKEKENVEDEVKNLLHKYQMDAGFGLDQDDYSKDEFVFDKKFALDDNHDFEPPKSQFTKSIPAKHGSGEESLPKVDGDIMEKVPQKGDSEVEETSFGQRYQGNQKIEFEDYTVEIENVGYEMDSPSNQYKSETRNQYGNNEYGNNEHGNNQYNKNEYNKNEYVSNEAIKSVSTKSEAFDNNEFSVNLDGVMDHETNYQEADYHEDNYYEDGIYAQDYYDEIIQNNVREEYYTTSKEYGYEDIEPIQGPLEINFQREEEILLNDDNAKLRKDSMRKKNANRGNKAVVYAIVALLVCSFASYYFISKRVMLDKFETALHNNNYTSAMKLYGDIMKNKKESADEMIVEKISDIKSRYSEAKITSNEALDELKSLLAIESGADQQIQQAITDFDKIFISEDYFDDGEKYFEDKMYENAILNYDKVIEEDSHYKTAQKQLKKVIAEYKSIEIKKAEEYAARQEFDLAIKYISHTAELLENDSDIQSKLKEYKAAKLALNIDDILSSAKDSIADLDYVAAIKTILDAITEYGDDKELTTKLEEYKKEMYAAIEDYVKNSRYNRAVKLLNSYVQVVTDDEKAKNMITEYTPFVSDGYVLTDLQWKSTKGRYYKTEDGKDYTDRTGTVFENSVELVGYRNLETEGKIVIQNDNYKELKGTIGYSNFGYFSKGSGKITIYADSKVIYESEVVSINVADQEVELEIPSCSEITITWEPSSKDDIQAYGIVLGDFKLVNANNEASKSGTTN